MNGAIGSASKYSIQWSERQGVAPAGSGRCGGGPSGQR